MELEKVLSFNKTKWKLLFRSLLLYELDYQNETKRDRILDRYFFYINSQAFAIQATKS